MISFSNRSIDSGSMSPPYSPSPRSAGMPAINELLSLAFPMPWLPITHWATPRVHCSKQTSRSPGTRSSGSKPTQLDERFVQIQTSYLGFKLRSLWPSPANTRSTGTPRAWSRWTTCINSRSPFSGDKRDIHPIEIDPCVHQPFLWLDLSQAYVDTPVHRFRYESGGPSTLGFVIERTRHEDLPTHRSKRCIVGYTTDRFFYRVASDQSYRSSRGASLKWRTDETFEPQADCIRFVVVRLKQVYFSRAAN